MADLPKPDVAVAHSTAEEGKKHNISVTISREEGKKSRTYSGEGSSAQEAIKESIEKMLGDERFREFVE